MTASTLIATVVADLKKHAPFGEIDAAQLSAFAASLSVRYAARGQIVQPAGEVVPSVFIVKTGRIVGERQGFKGQQMVALEVVPGEMFPIGAVLTDRLPESTFRAAQDTLLYVAPIAAFKTALAQLPALQDFCERRLFNLLERSRAALRAAYSAESLSEHPFSRPLESAIKRLPITCDTYATVGQALTLMQREKVGAIVIVDETQQPVGILTERDVIGRITLAQVALTEPVLPLASKPVVTLDAHSPISAAALLMVSKNFRHVVVTREQKVCGVVSERSLFALQRRSLSSISDAISAAPQVRALEQCANDIRELSRALVAQGVAAGLLTQFISQLNDQLTQRLLVLLTQTHPIARDERLRWCWLAFGSEGRHEQTISTDQDNGIVFSCDASVGDEAKGKLLAFAKDVNETLSRCGYPLCKGNIMASNPELCLTVHEWQSQFVHWMEAGDPQSLLNANIFFDMRALYGDASLVEEISHVVWPRAKSNARFCKLMADNALTHVSPLNWLGNIEADAAGVVDLKRLGAMPFTDTVRVFALAQGLYETRTRDRLNALRAPLHLSEDEVQGWVEAFEFIQMLRLRHQHDRLTAVQAGKPVRENANEIPVAQLSNLDARILREAFRQARKLQQRLALDYP